ncbi:MAG TPA: TolC family protein [Chondromyces sp.]|nr:TolC family protein [Chondromyces sp.]
MRKWAVALGTTVMVIMPFAVHADAVEEMTPVSEKDGDDQAENQLKVVNQLSLEDTLKLALENNKNLVVLKYELEALKNQTLSVIDDEANLRSDLRALGRNLRDLQKEKDRLDEAEEEEKDPQKRAQILNAIEALKAQITAVEQQIPLIEQQIIQLKSGEVQAVIQQEEVIEGVKLKIISDYVNLLGLQEQVEMKKQEIAYAKKDVQRAEQRFQLGAGAKDDIRLAKNNQTNLEQQLQKQQNNYQYSLAALSFDVGIQYNPDLTLEALDFTVDTIKKPSDIQAIIEETFQMKRVREELKLAQENRDQLYNHGGVSVYDELQYDNKVKAAEENIHATAQSLQQKVNALYNNLETSNFDYNEAVRQLETVKEDLAVLEKRYRLGVVPKFEVEKAQIQLEQINYNIEMLKIQNYLTQQSINSLLNGFIQ